MLVKNDQTFGSFYFYIRISEFEDKNKQIDSLSEKIGRKHDYLFLDTCLSGTLYKSEFERLKGLISQNDFICINSFDRIARNLKDLYDILLYFKNRNINLLSIKENYDSRSPESEVLIKTLSQIIKIELGFLQARQYEGQLIARHKNQFKRGAAILKPDNFDIYYQKYINRVNRYTIKQFMKDTNLKQSKLYQFITEHSNSSIENTSVTNEN